MACFYPYWQRNNICEQSQRVVEVGFRTKNTILKLTGNHKKIKQYEHMYINWNVYSADTSQTDESLQIPLNKHLQALSHVMMCYTIHVHDPRP